ncbi:MAG: PepSY domain-containing protein [Fimbriimonadaceae bacterium]
MYKGIRNLHKWAGLVACLFLMVISFTGFFLAIKGKVGWMRPDTKSGVGYGLAADLLPVGFVMDSAFAAGFPELAEEKHIDRMEFRAEEGVWKVLSRDGYREVQVDAVTGKILSKGQRNDQLFEDIHDMSFFATFWHEWGLPVVGFLLFWLSLSGVVMFFVPVVRRWKFNQGKKKENPVH